MIDKVDLLAKQLLELDARTDPKITSFPSGAFMLDVNIQGRRYVFEYIHSMRGFGVSSAESATFGWEGVEVPFDDFDSAKNYLLDLITTSLTRS
jgi:hypothetical protein